MIVRRVDELKRLVALIPESGLDLINVFRLVEAGDVLYSKTSRELKKERASGKIDSERVQVVLGIEVESKVADPLMKRIRFTGRIVYESRKLDLLGKYHTITLYPGVEIKVQSKKNFERLRAFSASYGRHMKKPMKVICISVDDYEIAVAEFSNKGLEVIYAKSLPSVDKSFSWSEPVHGEVFDEAIKAVKNRLLLDKDALVAVFGPKIFVERFMSYLRKSDKSLFEKVKASCSTSIGGEAGLREVLRMKDVPEFIQVLKPFRDAVETERFVEAMSRNPEKVAIGIDEVLDAWEMGAVEKVLISEGYLWGNLEDERLERLLKAAERGKLNLQVILDGLESSEKISRLGGAVAILRYPVPLKKIRKAKGD
ncbi:MAG: pelota family protein [Thaumarchaeota archaeon]|nr:pelota family protein [Nitrososphaerota archaeon]